jgi:hypothetical protein
MLVFFMAIWSIFSPFDIFYGHLVYLGVIWYIFPRFGMLHQEKSGNPVSVLALLSVFHSVVFAFGGMHFKTGSCLACSTFLKSSFGKIFLIENVLFCFLPGSVIQLIYFGHGKEHNAVAIIFPQYQKNT